MVTASRNGVGVGVGIGVGVGGVGGVGDTLRRRRRLPHLLILLLVHLTLVCCGSRATKHVRPGCTHAVAFKHQQTGSTWWADTLGRIPGVSVTREIGGFGVTRFTEALRAFLQQPCEEGTRLRYTTKNPVLLPRNFSWTALGADAAAAAAASGAAASSLSSATGGAHAAAAAAAAASGAAASSLSSATGSRSGNSVTAAREGSANSPLKVVLWRRTNIIRWSLSTVFLWTNNSQCSAHDNKRAWHVKDAATQAACHKKRFKVHNRTLLRVLTNAACDAAFGEQAAHMFAAGANALPVLEATYEELMQDEDRALLSLLRKLKVPANVSDMIEHRQKSTYLKASPVNLLHNMENAEDILADVHAWQKQVSSWDSHASGCALTHMLRDTKSQKFKCNVSALCKGLTKVESEARRYENTTRAHRPQGVDKYGVKMCQLLRLC